MTERFRVGTRRSRLARVQTAWVLARLARAAPGVRFEPVPVDTSGDRDRSAGSSPDFTDTIDRALLRGDVDLAVHSAKDLPVELDRSLDILACPRRADPRDCLVVAPEHRVSPLPQGARVGSSSLRRRAQLLRWRPDLCVVEVRGNVDTRIGLVRSGAVDAAVLAVAGLSRLGRTGEMGRILPPATFLPAPAQGALAVVVRKGDSPLASVVRRIDHSATHVCVTAERTFAAALGGDCRLPLGALATVRERTVSLVGEVLTPDGRRSLRRHRRGPASDADGIGSRLGSAMLDQGALDLMSPSRP
ncbi:MAG: hydroxymethylbilane synthase [Thermoplasmata archaeon]